jgi:hypothetical protein
MEPLMIRIVKQLELSNNGIERFYSVPTTPFLCLRVLESCLKQYYETFYNEAELFRVSHTACHQFGPGTCRTTGEETS